MSNRDENISTSFQVISNVDQFIEKSLEHTEPYVVTIDGLEIDVHPQVLSPKYSYSSQFIKQNWDIRPEMKVIDMGTGTGVLAVYAGQQGCTVLALDVNPYAVENTQMNIIRHQLQDKVQVKLSDLFSAVDEKNHVDRIVFNAPFWSRQADESIPLTLALFDENYAIANKFLEQARDFLLPEGRVLLCYSTQDERYDEIRPIIEKKHWTIEKEVKEVKGHTRVLLFLKDNLK